MPFEGQVQTKGDKKRVFTGGQWVEVEKIQTNKKTGERRAMANGQSISIPPKQAAPAPAPEMGIQQQAMQSPRGSLLNTAKLEEIRKDAANIPTSDRITMEQSHALPEYVPTEFKPTLAQTFLYEEDQAKMLVENNPGSESFRDAEGNIIWQDAEGKQHRLNAEGFSMGDVMGVAGDIGGVVGIGRMLKGLGGPVGKTFEKYAQTARGQAAGATAYSAGKDVAGNELTNETGVDRLPDISRSLTEGGFAGGAQRIISDFVAKPLSRWWDKKTLTNEIRKGLDSTPAGQLADTARIAMEKADIPTQGMSTAEIEAVNNALLDFPNLSGAELGRAISQQGVGGFNPSVGSVTQDPGYLYDQNMMRTSQGTPESRAAVTEQTIEGPADYVEGTVNPLDQPHPLEDTQRVLAEQRKGQYEDFSGVKQPDGTVVGGRFKDDRAVAREYELLPEQNQSIRDEVFDVVRDVEDVQVASDLAGHKPNIEPPEMGALPNPPKPRKPPKGRRPPKQKLPPKSLQVIGKEDKLAEWREIEGRQYKLKMNEYTDERAIQMREFEAEEAARMGEYETNVRQMTGDHEAALKRFEDEPPVPERVGGRAPAADYGADKNASPADWLNWAERMSSDRTQVGGQAAAKAVRDKLSDMARKEALDGVDGGVLDYIQTHSEYGDMIQEWSPDRLVGEITEKAASGSERLAVEPHRVADVLFGGRKGGFLTKGGATTAVQDLQARLSPEEWLPVRKELEFRLLGGGKGKAAGSEVRSPAVMSKNFDEAIQRHGEAFIETILDDGTGNGAEMLANYKRFFKISKDATTAPGKTSRIASDTAPATERNTALDSFAASRFKGPPGTNTILDVLRAGTRKARDVSVGMGGADTAEAMMNPNAFLAKPVDPSFNVARVPVDPTRLGILSQLRSEEGEKNWDEY